ncbi:MAG: hypothetical protein ACLTJG_07870 [[Clostridium] innocuum]
MYAELPAENAWAEELMLFFSQNIACYRKGDDNMIKRILQEVKEYRKAFSPDSWWEKLY